MDPLPGSLSTQMLPPCISARRLASARPSPVPSRFAPSSLCTCWKAWNSSLLILLGDADPGVAHRDLHTRHRSPDAATEIRPPSGVNFTALDSRLSRICLTLRSSPAKEFRRVSI